MQVSQLRAGVEPEFVAYTTADRPVDAERFLVSAGPAQGAHQVGGEAFVQRIPGDEFGQFADEILVPAGGEVSGDPHVQRLAPRLFQPCRETRPDRVGADVGQRRPAP
jgi:hypothetical protein